LKWSAFAPFDKLRTGFDRLRVNGSVVEIVEYCPFVLSLSKHEPASLGTNDLGNL